jgi:hypothetical protein
VQGLRAEDDIDERCPLADAVTFLAGYASTDTDQQIGALVFPDTPPAQLRKHFLLRLLANGTGIDEKQIRILGLDSRSTSAIFSESYSFIWQPNVLM